MNGPVLIGLLLACAAMVFVIAPLIFPRTFGVGVAPNADERAGRDEEDEEAALTGLRDAVYAEIVELDFEHAIGKSDEEEYGEERAALKRRAFAVLRTLDERAAARPDALDDAVEREVRLARLRRTARVAEADGDGADAPDLNDEVERQIRALRRSRHADAARAE